MFFRFFLFVTFFIPFVLKAQFQRAWTDTAESLTITLGAGAESYSNAIENRLLNKFYQGGFINQQLKDFSFENLKQKNRAGMVAQTGVCVAWPVKVKHLNNATLSLGLSQRFVFDTQFSPDAYRLFFYGNASFAGDTAHLNDFQYSWYHFRQLQMGFTFHFPDTSGRAGLAVSFLQGLQAQSFLLQQGNLYTSPLGDSLAATLRGLGLITESSNSFLGSFNQPGALVDFFVDIPLHNAHRIGSLKLNVQDLGFVAYNGPRKRFSADTTLSYTGISITNLSSLRDSVFESLNFDSLQKNLTGELTKRDFRTLPSLFHANLDLPLQSKLNLIAFGGIYFNSSALSVGGVGLSYPIGKGRLSAWASYGGYTRFQIPVQFVIQTKSKWQFKIRTNHLLGLPFIKNAHAQGVGLYLTKAF